MKTNSRKTIQSIAKDRGIDFLLHFTQIANLPGILKDGLRSRRDLEQSTHTTFRSARHRLDENDGAVSVSISRINDRMFWSKRQSSGHDNWVVLVLAPEILWTHRCIFCWRNAAKNDITRHRGRRDGPWAFAQMFSDRDGLPRNHPTDPEAEVQVLESIAPKYILGAGVNHSKMVEPVQRALSELFENLPRVIVGEF